MRIWVYYNPAASEAIIYENEPPRHFGRRQHDIGPIELEADLVRQYKTAKCVWHEAHSQFARARKASTRQRTDRLVGSCSPLARVGARRSPRRCGRRMGYGHRPGSPWMVGNPPSHPTGQTRTWSKSITICDRRAFRFTTFLSSVDPYATKSPEGRPSWIFPSLGETVRWVYWRSFAQRLSRVFVVGVYEVTETHEPIDEGAHENHGVSLHLNHLPKRSANSAYSPSRLMTSNISIRDCEFCRPKSVSAGAVMPMPPLGCRSRCA